MILRRLQKGQSVIEFALVLPLFLLFALGIGFLGMIMADYLYLSNLARSSAREAASISATDTESYKDHYKKIRLKYKNAELPMDIFKWQADSTKNFDINYDKNSQNVQVKMKAALNTEGSHLGNIVNGLAGGTKLAQIDITYTMYSEHEHK